MIPSIADRKPTNLTATIDEQSWVNIDNQSTAKNMPESMGVQRVASPTQGAGCFVKSYD